MLKYLLLCSLSVFASGQLLSLDFSQPATQVQFNSIKDDGYTDVALRAFSPSGTFDTNVCRNVKYALNAGLTTMIYMTPVPTLIDAKKHVTDLYEGLYACGLTYHKWWLQVVRPSHWGKVDGNVKFIKDVVSKATELKQTVGIYTSAEEWKEIVGDYTINDPAIPYAVHPLWYWSNSTTQDFFDFVPFGGWHGPLVKQFQQSVTVRNVLANKNIYAGNFR